MWYHARHGGVELYRDQGGLEVEARGGGMQGGGFLTSVVVGGGCQTAGSLSQHQSHQEVYKDSRCSAHPKIQTQWSEHLYL